MRKPQRRSHSATSRRALADTFARVTDLPATSAPRAVMVLSENTTLVPAHDLRALVEVARIAEDCGVHTVMLSEHVVLAGDSSAAGLMANPRDYAAPGNQHPHTAWPDSVVLASAIAQATSRLRVALAAVITPLRHPLLLAKQLGTLDLLAGGRLVVQPTVSWSRGEYDALGVPFEQRGRILDEQLAAMHAAWTAAPQAPSSHHGQHFSYGDVWVEPRRGAHLAMWFGGQQLHDVLIERIVRYGIGFHHRQPDDRADTPRHRAAAVVAGAGTPPSRPISTRAVGFSSSGRWRLSSSGTALDRNERHTSAA